MQGGGMRAMGRSGGLDRLGRVMIENDSLGLIRKLIPDGLVTICELLPLDIGHAGPRNMLLGSIGL